MQAKSTPSELPRPPLQAAAARSAGLALWGWPLAIALLSASGLISALVSDAWGDVWSWFALGVPVLVMAWFGLRRPSNGKNC